jgi:hypothetical protein
VGAAEIANVRVGAGSEQRGHGVRLPLAAASCSGVAPSSPILHVDGGPFRDEELYHAGVPFPGGFVQSVDPVASAALTRAPWESRNSAKLK